MAGSHGYFAPEATELVVIDSMSALRRFAGEVKLDPRTLPGEKECRKISRSQERSKNGETLY